MKTKLILGSIVVFTLLISSCKEDNIEESGKEKHLWVFIYIGALFKK